MDQTRCFAVISVAADAYRGSASACYESRQSHQFSIHQQQFWCAGRYKQAKQQTIRCTTFDKKSIVFQEGEPCSISAKDGRFLDLLQVMTGNAACKHI